MPEPTCLCVTARRQILSTASMRCRMPNNSGLRGMLLMPRSASVMPAGMKFVSYSTRALKSSPAMGSCLSQRPRISIRTRCFDGAGCGLIRTTLTLYFVGDSAMAMVKSCTR